MTTTVSANTQPVPSGGVWSGGKHLFPVRVYYENTDAGGVVYHAQYLNFAERARTEGLRLLGVSQRAAAGDLQIAFVVSRAEIDFKRPARLDDLLLIETAFIKVGNALMDLSQTIRRDNDLLVEIFVRVACVSVQAFRPVRIPPEIRALIPDNC